LKLRNLEIINLGFTNFVKISEGLVITGPFAVLGAGAITGPASGKKAADEKKQHD
jgi:hypothetical protein